MQIVFNKNLIGFCVNMNVCQLFGCVYLFSCHHRCYQYFAIKIDMGMESKKLWWLEVRETETERHRRKPIVLFDFVH